MVDATVDVNGVRDVELVYSGTVPVDAPVTGLPIEELVGSEVV